ncbi:MAG: hypothetical protein Q9161_005408 [Pseudevernia consocians]
MAIPPFGCGIGDFLAVKLTGKIASESKDMRVIILDLLLTTLGPRVSIATAETDWADDVENFIPIYRWGTDSQRTLLRQGSSE